MRTACRVPVCTACRLQVLCSQECSLSASCVASTLWSGSARLALAAQHEVFVRIASATEWVEE